MADSPDGAAYDTSDVMRANSWEMMAGDHLVTELPDLYVLLGVAGARHSQKLDALRSFTQTPAWHAAPAALKHKAEEALHG